MTMKHRGPKERLSNGSISRGVPRRLESLPKLTIFGSCLQAFRLKHGNKIDLEKSKDRNNLRQTNTKIYIGGHPKTGVIFEADPVVEDCMSLHFRVQLEPGTHLQTTRFPEDWSSPVDM